MLPTKTEKIKAFRVSLSRGGMETLCRRVSDHFEAGNFMPTTMKVKKSRGPTMPIKTEKIKASRMTKG
jgi:hypothetical protein